VSYGDEKLVFLAGAHYGGKKQGFIRVVVLSQAGLVKKEQ